MPRRRFPTGAPYCWASHTRGSEAIAREQDNFEAEIPESFNVLELKSPGPNVELDIRSA
jgi:hypothetical protein